MKPNRHLKTQIVTSAAFAASAVAQRIENDGKTPLPAGAQRAVDASAPKLTRAQRKAMQRAAVDELVASERLHVNLNHIHPRSKREEIKRRLDAGEDVFL